MPQIKLSKIPRVMFILSVNQLSNFVRPNPLKSHCRKRDIDEEFEKANGHSGTFSGLCNTHTQNVRIWKEFTNYGPTPASLTVLLARQMWTPFALIKLHTMTDPGLGLSFSNLFLP